MSEKDGIMISNSLYHRVKSPLLDNICLNKFDIKKIIFEQSLNKTNRLQ